MLTSLRRAHEVSTAEVTAAAEVAAVLEEMLVDLELCHSEARRRRHARELSEKQAHLELMAARVEELEAMRRAEVAQAAARGHAARGLREKLVAELWTLSKHLKEARSLEKRLEGAERQLEKVPKLEKELEQAQREARALHALGAASGLQGLGPQTAGLGNANASAGTTAGGAAGGGSAGVADAGPPSAPASAPPELAGWLQKALGGKKWKAKALEYAGALSLAKLPSHGALATPTGAIEAVRRLSRSELVRLGGLSPKHALLVSVHPPPASPIAAYRAPLLALEDKLLLKTFSFLHAPAVLSAAQVNVPIFTRVDALFGMGSSLNTNGLNSASSPPPPPPPPKGPHPANAAAAAAAAGPAGLAAGRGVESGDSRAMLGDLAKKIAAKLNSSEMKGIVQMTERIRRLEAEVMVTSEAREDLEQRAASVESVKDFLVEKLRDTELVLKRTMDDANESARQRQADAEVISFLDSRVHALELELSTAQKSGQAERDQRAKADAAAARRTKHLEETLAWETARFENQARDLKGQRKVLARAVKMLRDQVAGLSSDRDAYKRQAHALQRRES